MNGLAILVVTLVAGTLIGVWARRRDGKVRTLDTGDIKNDVRNVDFGEPLGERATLVQFSTAFCQPCRATRRVLGEVAEMVPGVRHIEIDAESRLDLVREFNVLRTPTVLVLDDSGNVVKRASGAPRKADVIAALGHAVDTPSRHADGM